MKGGGVLCRRREDELRLEGFVGNCGAVLERLQSKQPAAVFGPAADEVGQLGGNLAQALLDVGRERDPRFPERAPSRLPESRVTIMRVV